jgi:hypothetical protein
LPRASTTDESDWYKGLGTKEWALPPTLVARFQKDAYRRMLERAGVDANNPADRTTGEVDGVAEIGAVRRCPRGGWGAGGYRQPPEESMLCWLRDRSP